MIPAAGTVFVVDDNAAVRASLRTLFGAAGLHVETYASSADFLAAYDSRRPGCLVLDLKLRGESGLDLLEQLPPRPATLPVIVLTAYGSVPASVRAMNAGAIDFVEKSMRPAQLLGCVRTALELAGRQHEVEAAQQAIVQRGARHVGAAVVQAVEVASSEGYAAVHLTAEFLRMNVRTLQRGLPRPE